MGASAAYWVSAAVAAGSAVSQHETARKARNATKDQAFAAKAVEVDAAQDANARLAQRRRALAANSLATGGGTTGMPAGGRTTLGG